ncbi:hypothetical protein [Paraburkholderia atlantica]|uniref:hypothetical protein n=1 Tax=Paraburkholderia atlantica TaxID=2654982 RepID=UPI00160DA7E9|nr:hypothetical protein [Paraburkholderia atlantica]MBB5509574.1 uncharacterized protein YceH (UPF0502 family) [Paraburkholderia atlantica]
MSIQLTMKVETLERQVIALEQRIGDLEYCLRGISEVRDPDVDPKSLRMGMASLSELIERVTHLEQTAARKPGPKPKDSNG